MKFQYSPEEIEAQEAFATFCQENLRPLAAQLDRASPNEAQKLLRGHLLKLAERDYLGINLPRNLGGQEKTLVNSLPFHELVARACPATFVSLEASAGMVGRMLGKAGTDQQKERHLRRIITGESLAAFAVTEPSAGSDLFGMTTTAVASGEGWVLDGTKTMITNAPEADLLLVMAVSDREAGERGFSFFLVDRETDGVSFGEPVETMGLRGSLTGEVSFQAAPLPPEALLGEPGEGYALYREAMTEGRIRYAALSVGISRACLELSLEYANQRKVSEKPIFKHQEVSFKIADMHTLLDTSRQLARHAAWLCDRGAPERAVQASCAKLFASESAQKIAHMAQQIFGGYGYLKTSEIERLYRDARFCELGKGTSEIQCMEIADSVFRRFGKEEKPRVFTKPHSSRRVGMPRKIPPRVAICAVAQTPYERNRWEERFQGMALTVLESLLEQTGLDFSEERGIHTSISVSDDVFDARTISDNAMTDVLGAHFRCEEKVAQDGAQAVYYGLATILSGHADVVLVIGHCKESQARSRNRVTHLAFDPFYTRPVGLDFTNAAALQAQAYLAKSPITEEQLAKVVVRARKFGSRNPYTRTIQPVSEQEVLNSPMLADPIRELHAYPVSDGAVGLILASEERAKQLTDTPVWITGVGNCFDSFFLGDRKLSGNFALEKAARRAYQRAGITAPASAFDVIEISDQYAYQQPMWMEGLGLCEEGKGGQWLDDDGPDRMHVNHSGGMLAGNPMMLGGLVRVAETAQQLSGKAENRQVNGARTALAHGVMGPAGQFHSVVILQA